MNQHFEFPNIQKKQQKFLTMFNFQHSQITQEELEQPKSLKYPKVYATSKFDVGKKSSPFCLPLKTDAVFKKQRARKVPIHLQNKVIRFFEIIEQYETISTVNKEEQPKSNIFKNPVIIWQKENKKNSSGCKITQLFN